MNNQTTKLSNRELRKNRAELARSEAINRFIDQCKEETKLARQDMYLYTGIASFFCLIFLSALLGLK